MIIFANNIKGLITNAYVNTHHMCSFQMFQLNLDSNRVLKSMGPPLTEENHGQQKKKLS